ncbi:glyoxalase [Wenyingzhuangia sp. IMCC45467]
MESKKAIRPNIPSAKVDETMSIEEQFQNAVLRPVIKMQHSLITALFQHFLQHSEYRLDSLEKHQKDEFIKTSVSRNQHLKNQYIGMISGMFTDEEFIVYLKNISEYNKRIIQIIAQRLQNSF